MSASRNASTLLLALLSTIVLFAIFVATASISFLSKHSYALDYGWQTSRPDLPGQYCNPELATKGFPIKTDRHEPGEASGCLDQTNLLAHDMNLALCFAAAAIISTGAASLIKKT